MILCANILAAVAQAHEVSVESLIQPDCLGSRHHDFARPRQEAMFLCREMAHRSLPDIGRRFGNRDHTTVLHAVRAVEQRMETDEETRLRIDAVSVGLLL